MLADDVEGLGRLGSGLAIGELLLVDDPDGAGAEVPEDVGDGGGTVGYDDELEVYKGLLGAEVITGVVRLVDLGRVVGEAVGRVVDDDAAGLEVRESLDDALGVLFERGGELEHGLVVVDLALDRGSLADRSALT